MIFRRREPKDGRPVRHRPHCSFCGTEQRKQVRLVAGPGVYICSDCVSLAWQMLRANMGPPPPLPS